MDCPGFNTSAGNNIWLNDAIIRLILFIKGIKINYIDIIILIDKYNFTIVHKY